MTLQAVSTLFILPWLLLAVALAAFGYAVYHQFFDGLSHIPVVHWSAKWSRCHLLWTKYFYSTKVVFYNAHLNDNDKAGFRPLLRVAPNEVSIMTSEGVRIVWGAGFDRSSWYEVFSNFGCGATLTLSKC